MKLRPDNYPPLKDLTYCDSQVMVKVYCDGQIMVKVYYDSQVMAKVYVFGNHNKYPQY